MLSMDGRSTSTHGVGHDEALRSWKLMSVYVNCEDIYSRVFPVESPPTAQIIRTPNPYAVPPEEHRVSHTQCNICTLEMPR